MNRPFILKAKWVWTGRDNKTALNRAVLVERGRIRGVGTMDEMPSTGCDVHEFSNATILPGLIDSHTHLSMDASIDNFLDHMTDDVATLTLRAAAMMRRDLQSGVTACRCLGDREFLDVACKDAVSTGLVAGPHLLIATRGIRAPEGHGFVGYPFKGIDAILNAIDKNISMGADLIKIYITGTLKGSDGQLPAFLSREEISAIIDYAHKHGKPVASHCVGGIGLDWALESCLDTLEHAYHITEKQAERLARSTTSLVLTPGAELLDERVARLPENSVDGHRQQREDMFASMALALATGMPFGVGTDGMHGHLWEDLVCLSELGATNAQALQAATLHGAKVCGIQNETGSLESGKRADIVVVEGNPLEDLRSLRNVVTVIKDGIVVNGNRGILQKQTEYDIR